MDTERGLYQLHVDGGRQHPRQGELPSAAVAFVLCNSKGQELSDGRHSRRLDPPAPDSTSAEYEAVLAGLEEARNRDIDYIAVFTDSRNLVNQMWGRFHSSGHLADYRDKLERALGAFTDWQLSWIPREWNKAHRDVGESL